MPLNRANQRFFRRTLFAGMLETVTLLKRDDDQQEGTVRALTLFGCRHSVITKTGEQIAVDETADHRTTWHLPRTELQRVGVDHINSLDRIVDRYNRFWQPEATTTITIKLFELEIDLDCGEQLVLVKGAGALGDASGHGFLNELGLSSGPITVVLNFYHYEININDFGPNVPVELLTMLASATIRMSLVHYDQQVLQDCVTESLGGGTEDGTFPLGAGVPLGGGVPLFAPGNHYISLNLAVTTPSAGPQSWRFPHCYLIDSVEIPLGTEKTVAVLTWKAIPYAFSITTTEHTLSTTPAIDPFSKEGNVITIPGASPTTTVSEMQSKGVIIWDHLLDQ